MDTTAAASAPPGLTASVPDDGDLLGADRAALWATDPEIAQVVDDEGP